MGIHSRDVEVCDLENGVVVLDSSNGADTHGRSPLRLTVTDRHGELHDLPSQADGHTIRFAISGGVRPIRSFTISEPGHDRILFRLENLFPETDKEFQTQFKSHRDRSGDRHVDYFVASQIFDYFTGQEGFRISAAVVSAYKAIELMEEKCLNAAENMLLRSLAALPDVELSRSTRNNREHLHISVLCALYHVHLARGNFLSFLNTLKVIHQLLEKESFHSYYNLAYNGALSLRLLTLLHLIEGRQEAARETATLTFEVFKLATRDADENLAHFKELRYVHDNAYESMRIARRVKVVTESLVDKTLTACLRISAGGHPVAYGVMRATFLGSDQSAGDTF